MAVGTGVGELVGTTVRVGVEVLAGGTVGVDVGAGCWVGVDVGVRLGVAVWVCVGDTVGVRVGEDVAVGRSVAVEVGVGEVVGLGVGVTNWVGVGSRGPVVGRAPMVSVGNGTPGLPGGREAVGVVVARTAPGVAVGPCLSRGAMRMLARPRQYSAEVASSTTPRTP